MFSGRIIFWAESPAICARPDRRNFRPARRRHAIRVPLAKRRDDPLYPLQGDVSSVANDINAQGQVVGVSCDANFNCRAVLWDHGVVTDLNSLVPTGSLQLTYGGGINDRGEIAGTAFNSSKGDSPAFLAIPAPAGIIDGEGGVVHHASQAAQIED